MIQKINLLLNVPVPVSCIEVSLITFTNEVIHKLTVILGYFKV